MMQTSKQLLAETRRLMKPAEVAKDALRCPFCGAHAEIQYWHGGGPQKRHIGCSNVRCEISPGVTGSTRERAIKKWNTRAAHVDPRR
jgi:hypothetical protein